MAKWARSIAVRTAMGTLVLAILQELAALGAVEEEPAWKTY